MYSIGISLETALESCIWVLNVQNGYRNIEYDDFIDLKIKRAASKSLCLLTAAM